MYYGTFVLKSIQVHKWLKELGVLSKRIVLIPVNTHGTHWILIVVTRLGDMSQPFEIEVFDSYHKNVDRYIITVKELWQRMLKDDDMPMKLHKDFPHARKMIQVIPVAKRTVPRQTNTIDCGVFVCMFAFCCVHEIKMNSFTQQDVPFFREHIGISLLSGKIENLFKYPKFV